MSDKKIHPTIKPRLHPNNKHRERYDFKELIASCPELSEFVILNKYKDESIDFADSAAVKMLNKALLKHHYGINNWDIPEGYLCPPIPGRADYIHYMADLLCASNYGKMPDGKQIKCLDIGVGANCVYPIIGITDYGWSFIGSDIDTISIDSAQNIIGKNPFLKSNLELRHQAQSKDILYGIITKEERIDLSICNPPYHASKEAAAAVNMRKVKNLSNNKILKPSLNFGGQSNELWCDGGEKRFVSQMIRQSKNFADSCFWFSTLVSKQSNLKGIYADLKTAAAVDVKTIPMGQGNKSSRIVAWTFLDKEQQKDWRKERWESK